MEKTKMVRVIATARGHDGVHVREPGDVFEVPDSLLNHTVKLTDEKGKATGETEVRNPSWFKAVDKKGAPAADAPEASEDDLA